MLVLMLLIIKVGLKCNPGIDAMAAHKIAHAFAFFCEWFFMKVAGGRHVFLTLLVPPVLLMCS